MLTLGDAATEQRCLRDALDRGVDRPCLMGWRYAVPAVVLGRGQRASAELLERAGRERLEVVARVSGGGTVMAGPWMLSVTLLLPAVHSLATASLPAGYRAIGESCRRALQRVRVPAQVAGHGATAAAVRAAPGDAVSWACFANVSHGELAAGDGGKILGIAQVRRRDATAVCIGVLVGRPDWETLVRVWSGRDDPGIVQQLERRTASCDQFLPDCGTPFIEALGAALEAELATSRPPA